MLDCLRRGEAPYGSHVIYPRVLKDASPEERTLGMEAGFAWGRALYAAHERWLRSRETLYAAFPEDYESMLSVIDSAQIAVYDDYGITDGMSKGISKHMNNGIPVVYRQLGENWESALSLVSESLGNQQ